MHTYYTTSYPHSLSTSLNHRTTAHTYCATSYPHSAPFFLEFASLNMLTTVHTYPASTAQLVTPTLLNFFLEFASLNLFNVLLPGIKARDQTVILHNSLRLSGEDHYQNIAKCNYSQDIIMFTIEYFEGTVKMLRKSLQHAVDGVANGDDIQRWLELTSNAIECLTSMLTSTLTRPEKQRHQTTLSHLLCIQEPLHQFSKRGLELQPSASRVKWDDSQSAFETRIRSGIITNLDHLDIGHSSIMDEAFPIIEQEVKDAFIRLNAIKINIELAAKYALQKNDGETLEVKYFNTKNASIYESLDLKDWLEGGVKSSLETGMEEFQENGSGLTLRQIIYLTVNINKLIN